MKKTIIALLLTISSLVIGEPATSFLLGQSLRNEGLHEMAAIEFRRFFLEQNEPKTPDPLLHAAHSYLEAERPMLAQKMLQEAEAHTVEHNPELAILQAEQAFMTGNTEAAVYFLETANPDRSDLQIFARKRTLEWLVRGGQVSRAIQLSDESEKKAIEVYQSAPEKSPLVGGLMGLFPGAGYWYSGETANGFRSLILNSIFMFGMVHTAQEDQWGAFAAISFFEITWYSGSIYGGIDAAHRYNQRQMEHCIDQLAVPDLQPDQGVTIPLFKLKVLFE